MFLAAAWVARRIMSRRLRARLEKEELIDSIGSRPAVRNQKLNEFATPDNCTKFVTLILPTVHRNPTSDDLKAFFNP